MFLIDVKINTDKVPAGRAEELLNGHRQWFGKHFEDGDFLIVGPYHDIDMAGIVIAQAKSKEDLEAIIAEDSYYPDMATYTIHSFKANMVAENISDYKGK